MQGQRRTWYAGAWLGHGFHEDGLKSAIDVVNGLRGRVVTPARAQAAA
jgi:predicted NAD/FAD-binding protein